MRTLALVLVVATALAGCLESSTQLPSDLATPPPSSPPLAATPLPDDAIVGSGTCREVPTLRTESQEYSWPAAEDGNGELHVNVSPKDTNLSVELQNLVTKAGFLAANGGKTAFSIMVRAPNGTTDVLASQPILLYVVNDPNAGPNQEMQSWTRNYPLEKADGAWTIYFEGRGTVMSRLTTTVLGAAQECGR